MRVSSLIAIFFIILTFCVSNGPDNVNATFWDGCAGVSQVKSILQYIGGYKEDAKQTQKNFLNQMIGVSQLKSIAHVINKDYKAARQTQKIFYKEMVEPLVDSTPIIGHIKACIHLIIGDKDRALNVLKDASRSTAIFIGAGVSGPAAAYMAGVAADAVITGIDSYKAERYLPYGTFDYLRHFKEASFSEHFDILADMAFIGEGGNFYSNYKTNRKQKPFTPMPVQGIITGELVEKTLRRGPPPKKWYRKILYGGGTRAKRKKVRAKLEQKLYPQQQQQKHQPKRQPKSKSKRKKGDELF